MRTILKALRESAGASQTKVAFLAGTTQSRLSAAECGRLRLSRPTLARLAAVLNFSGAPEELLSPANGEEIRQ